MNTKRLITFILARNPQGLLNLTSDERSTLSAILAELRCQAR